MKDVLHASAIDAIVMFMNINPLSVCPSIALLEKTSQPTVFNSV